MDSKPKFESGRPDCLLGGEDMSLLCNSFEGSTKEMDGNRRTRFESEM